MIDTVLEQLESLRNDPLLASLSAQQPAASTSSVAHPFTQSASELLQQKASNARFSSGSAAFDSLIVTKDDDPARGLAPGQILELTGCPGEGKTRACVSYAIQASIRDKPEQAAPIVLIVDTQGSITLQTLYEAAKEVCDNDAKTVLALLERIFLWTCTETDDLIVALQTLPHFIESNPSIKLVIVDSLSSALHAHLVPTLSSTILQELEAFNKSKKASTKKRRKPSKTMDPKVDASHFIVRQTLATTVKEAMMQLSARSVSVIVTTQSRTKLTDEFGEPTSFRDAKHSFAVPQFTNFWHIPYTTQIILSAGSRGVRNAMVSVTPSSMRGQSVAFQTKTGGIADG